MATKRLCSVERRLNKDTSLNDKYKAFMNEYIKQGHMNPIPTTDDLDNYYFPYHVVLKEDSITTKVRVVFDRSAKTSTGTSLNQCLMVGPIIQDNLVAIVVQFRLHRIVVSADIKQMYRHILVSKNHHKYQRILWRNEITEPITTYELQTVTYGTSSAPYLATKCLQQLSKDGSNIYPTGAHITARDFYVDDLLTGADSIAEVISIRDEVTKLCASAGFDLNKWASNCTELLDDTTSETITNLLLDKNSTTKTLGIQWNTTNYTFLYALPTIDKLSSITKRNILSYSAQIFDPLGHISVVRAKIILQTLWKLGIGWDESLPISIYTSWIQYLTDFKELQNLTIPRLELCGAWLLARMVASVLPALHIKPTHIYYWSNSTIVLSWIKATNKQLKPFVGNCVKEIRKCSEPNQWFHVLSGDNPADIVSRGKSCKEFMQTTIWWNGPSWLSKSSSHWPSQPPLLNDSLPEEKTTTMLATITNTTDQSLFEKYSKLRKLTNFVADRTSGVLTTRELSKATTSLVKFVQKAAFQEKLAALPYSANCIL